MPKKPIARFWAYEEGTADSPAMLRLDGPIAEESWFGDEVTPAAFRADLAAHPGDLIVYINSPGGDVIAGSLIYSMLREHDGKVTVRIDGIAASAASVVAMAGDTVEISPTAYMMIHNAGTIAFGNKHDLQHEASVLDEVDKGIRTAYRIRTGLSDKKLQQMMDDETWMSAATAIALGFADRFIGADEEDPDEDEPDEDAPAEGEPAPAAPDEEDDPDEEREDLMRHVARMRDLPVVAWSPVRQGRDLERRLAAINMPVTAPIDMRIQQVRADQVRDDHQEEIDAAMDARLRLQLLGL